MIPEVSICPVDTLTLPEMVGFFYLIFKMYVGYVKSNIELLNCRLWQDIYSFNILSPYNYFPLHNILICNPSVTNSELLLYALSYLVDF